MSCEVFLGVSIRDVRDSNEMTGPGSVQLYSWHVYSTAACVQCTAGQLPPSPQRPVGRRRAGGPESWAVFSAGPARRLSETNHLQLKFFVLQQMQVNEDLKFWNYLKQIIYNIPQLMRQMQVNKDLKFWNNEETVKAEVWKDYLKQITRYSHSYANTHSLTW